MTDIEKLILAFAALLVAAQQDRSYTRKLEFFRFSYVFLLILLIPLFLKKFSFD